MPAGSATLDVIYRIAADISGLEKGVSKVAESTGKMEMMAGRLGKALTAAFSVTAILAAGKQFLNFAGDLVDLSQKTGITTAGLQKLDLAFQQSGVSLETVTSSVTKLGRALIEGDKSTVGALQKLGLSVADLKKMNPEQQFIAVGDAIGKIANPTEKAYAALTIFGKGGAELLQGLTGNLKETTDEFEKMGLIVSDDALQAADKFGDQLVLMGRQLLGLVGVIIGPLLPALSSMLEGLMAIAKAIAAVVGPVIKALMVGIFALNAEILDFVATILEMAQKIPILGKHLGVLGDGAEVLRGRADRLRQMMGDLVTGTQATGTAAQTAAPALIGLGDASDKAAKDAKKLAEELAKNAAAARALEPAFYGLTEAVNDFRGSEIEALKATIAIRDVIGEIEGNAALAAFGMRGLAGSLEDVGEKTKPVIEDLHAIYGALGDIGPEQEIVIRPTLGDFVKQDLGKIILGAFQGGGNVAKSIGAGIGGFLTSGVSNIGAKIADVFKPTGMVGGMLTKVMGQGFGKLLGGALGSVIPGLGTLVGGLVGGLLPKLFGGPSEQELQGRMVTKSFGEAIQSTLTAQQKAEAGGVKWKETVIGVRDAYLAAGRTAKEAEDAVSRLWAAEKQGPEAAKKVQDEILAVMNTVGKAQEKLQAAIQRYGFSMAELGPALRRQALDKQAMQLLEDWHLLTAAGIDIVTVADKMGESTSAWLQGMIDSGQEVDVAMRPMLEKMASMGKLTDANGNKIEDLEAAGVNFTLTMSEGFKTLIDEVRKLTAAIARDLGLAIQNIPDPEITGKVRWDVDPIPGAPPRGPGGPRIDDDPFGGSDNSKGAGSGDEDFSRHWDDERYAVASGGWVTRHGIQRFALGGLVRPRGTDTVPAMLTPGEMILNKSQQDAMARAMSGSAGRDTYHVHMNISTIDAQSFRDLMTRPGGGADLFIEAISRRKRGRDVKLARAMGR